MTRSPLATGLLVLGVLQLAQGAWMAIDPGSFFDALGPFGERNDHYIRDAATPTLALGVAAVLASGRASWRVPVLVFATVWFGLHGVNHLVDISEADPESVGVIDFVALVGLTAATAYGVVLARREEAV